VVAIYARLQEHASNYTSRAHALLLAPHLSRADEIVHLDHDSGLRATALAVVVQDGVHVVREKEFRHDFVPIGQIENGRVVSHAFGGKHVQIALRTGETLDLPAKADATRTILVIRDRLEQRDASASSS
jgi:hypothetical protein